MKKVMVLRLALLPSLLFLAAVSGCSQQQVSNSPCTTLNATVQVKPSAELSVLFGNDAIQAAIDAITAQLAKQPSMSARDLSKMGTEAALRTAQTSGKAPTSESTTTLEAYLREDVVPTVKQYPTCVFNVSSPSKPYVGIDSIRMKTKGGNMVPEVQIKNTGLAEANTHIVIRYIVGGTELSKGQPDLVLGPSQSRGISVQGVNLPMSEIKAGQVILTVAIDFSYPPEPGANPILRREAWRYHSQDQAFYLAAPN